MKRTKTGVSLVISVCLMTLLLLTQVAYSQVTTWQAQPGYVVAIQNQLNALQAQIAQFLLPPSASAGQFIIENAAGNAYVAATITGDISASNATPGKLTVTGLDNIAFCPAMSAPSSGSSLTFNGTTWCPSGGVTPPGPVVDQCSNMTCDAQTTTATWTNGSATVALSGPPLANPATDVGKGIVLVNSGSSANTVVFVGTIATVAAGGASITVNTALTCGANCGTGGPMVWKTLDDTAWAAVNTLMQNSTGSQGGGTFYCHSPMMFAGTMTIGPSLNIEFRGTGEFARFQDNSQPFRTCLIMDANTTADQYLMLIQGSPIYLHDVALSGETSGITFPPAAIIGIRSGTGGGISSSAVVERVSDRSAPVSPSSFLAANQISSTDVAKGATAIPLATPTGGGTPSLINELGPNQPLYIRDYTGGFEIIYTAPSYTRGANPITLATATQVLHTVANTFYGWYHNYQAVSGIRVVGSKECPGCANSDTLSLNDDFMAEAAVGFDQQQNQSVNDRLMSDIALFTGIAYSEPNGGSMKVDQSQANNTDLKFYIGGNGIAEVHGFTVQDASTNVAGGSILAIMGPGNLTFYNGAWPQNSFQPVNGEMVMIGPSASPVNLGFQNFGINRSSNFPPTTAGTIVSTIHSFIGGTQELNITGTYTVGGTTPMYLNYMETGTGVGGSRRDWNVCELMGIKGPGNYRCTQQLLQGTDTWHLWDNMTPGSSKNWYLAIPQLGAPGTPVVTASGTCGTGTDYYYVAAVASDPAGAILSAPSAISARTQCGGTLDSVNNYLSVQVVPPIGGVSVNLYEASGPDPLATPALSSFALAYNQPYNTSAFAAVGNSPNLVGFWDNGTGTVGAAPPAASINGTGQLLAGGPVTAGHYTIATLPVACPQVGAQAVVTNNVACVYGATPVATASAGVDCPVFCDQTQSKWFIH